MLCIRYGRAEEPAAAEALDVMTEVQNRIRHVDPEPPDRQAAVGKKCKVRMLVTSSGSVPTRRPAP
eukprot:5699660-Pleurochrysis_carterae.AAC.1